VLQHAQNLSRNQVAPGTTSGSRVP